MQNQGFLTVPNDWAIPKHCLGQRTKQGLIVGIKYHPPGSLIAEICGEQWQYAVLGNNNDETVKYWKQDEVQPLTDEEVKAAILSEIEAHKQKIAILTQQLMTISHQ